MGKDDERRKVRIMGFLNMIFGKNTETDDQKEIREYEKTCKSYTDITDNYNAEFIVADTFSIQDRGTVVVGTVTTGKFSTGDKVIIYSESGNRIETVIDSLEEFRKIVSEVSEGANAGILFRDIQKNQIRKNDIIKNVPRGTI